MIDEDKFMRSYWEHLNERQEKGDESEILALGDADPSTLESVEILYKLIHKGYFELARPDRGNPFCFKFTECGEEHAKFLSQD